MLAQDRSLKLEKEGQWEKAVFCIGFGPFETRERLLRSKTTTPPLCFLRRFFRDRLFHLSFFLASLSLSTALLHLDNHTHTQHERKKGTRVF